MSRKQEPVSSRGLVTYDDENETESSSSEVEEESHSTEAQLPADFFDTSTKPGNADETHDSTDKKLAAACMVTFQCLIKSCLFRRKASDTAIPEGFFDDPVMDAKVPNECYICKRI
jgi:hypothetical protein